MFMNKKELYTSPEVETLVVRFEGVICGSPNGSFEDPADVDDGDAQVFW